MLFHLFKVHPPDSTSSTQQIHSSRSQSTNQRDTTIRTLESSFGLPSYLKAILRSLADLIKSSWESSIGQAVWNFRQPLFSLVMHLWFRFAPPLLPSEKVCHPLLDSHQFELKNWHFQPIIVPKPSRNYQTEAVLHRVFYDLTQTLSFPHHANGDPFRLPLKRDVIHGWTSMRILRFIIKSDSKRISELPVFYELVYIKTWSFQVYLNCFTLLFIQYVQLSEICSTKSVDAICFHLKSALNF